MAYSGQTITKSSIIDDFISAVMAPARNTSRITSSSNLPTTNQQMWDNGGIRTTIANPVYAYDSYGNPYVIGYTYSNVSLSCINTNLLRPGTDGLSDPTTSNLPSSAIVANEIISTCRMYAYNTTRIRKVQYGLYYTQYSYGQYFGSGVPASGPPYEQIPIYGTAYDNYGNPYTTIIGYNTGAPVYTGTLNPGTSLAHITSNYSVAIPSSVGGEPTTGGVVSASQLNSFYNNLRYYADANTNGSGTVDLRICHTSCHNNCHSARGRR